jgi:hypothetical protein
MLNKSQNKFAINLRYFLFQNEVPKEDWIAWLSGHLNIPQDVSEKYLRVGCSDPIDQEKICDLFGVGLDDMMIAELYPNQDPELTILNVQSLLQSLNRGEHTLMAKSVGVDLTTISKWKRGVRPREEHLQKIQEYFHTPSYISLTKDLIYLELDPVTLTARKEYLIKLVNNVSSEMIERHYLSLKLLLEEK